MSPFSVDIGIPPRVRTPVPSLVNVSSLEEPGNPNFPLFKPYHTNMTIPKSEKCQAVAHFSNTTFISKRANILFQKVSCDDS